MTEYIKLRKNKEKAIFKKILQNLANGHTIGQMVEEHRGHEERR